MEIRLGTSSIEVRLLKGALVTLQSTFPFISAVTFQYNPATLSRSMRPTHGTDENSGTRLLGPPGETIKVEIELDATDKLAEGSQVAQLAGIHPAIASLELLIYPSMSVSRQLLAAVKGTKEIAGEEPPLTLFIWGPNRVQPVRLTGLEITEQEFDAWLNPIRATAQISLEALSFADSKLGKGTRFLAFTHYVRKKAMGAALDGIGGTGIDAILKKLVS